MTSDFIVFIISHGRPDAVKTLHTIQRLGYTGDYRIVLDDLDKTRDQYEKNFPGKVVVFDKVAIAKTTDNGDNFENYRTTTHARNACFDIAEDLGIEYFLVLDDDYVQFSYRFDHELKYVSRQTYRLDAIFHEVLEFYKKVPNLKSIALCQGGDFIGGPNNSSFGGKITLKRKCMNSFFCSTKRRFKFFSRLNEDVNTYITLGSRGDLFFSLNQVILMQMQTQTTAGGMTEAYLESGTYVKSFYSVMYMPSAARVKIMATKFSRLHHRINWPTTVPKILRESVKKKE